MDELNFEGGPSVRTQTAYHNADSVPALLENLAKTYQDVCHLVTLPQKTWRGSTCHALQVGAGKPAERDAIVLIGGVHAREWGSTDILVNLAADLLKANKEESGLRYGGQTFTSEQIQELCKNRHIVILPLVNPDGLRLSQVGDWWRQKNWRKNLRPNDLGDEYDGVDVNRNFDFLFKYREVFHKDAGVVVTDDPTAVGMEDCYQGPEAFSEPESTNVRHLLDTYQRTRWFVDVHNHGPSIMYPWGHAPNQTADPTQHFRNPDCDQIRGKFTGDGKVVPKVYEYHEYLPLADLDEVRKLATAFQTGLHEVRGVEYQPKPSFDLYPTCGASDDYAYSRQFRGEGLGKIYPFTVEFGTEFRHKWTAMEDIIKDVCTGLISLSLATL